MVEAMACGAPVIAFAEGSAPEVVIDGESGFVVEDEDAMASAVGRLGEIDRGGAARRSERFDVPRVARDERVYDRQQPGGGRVSPAAPQRRHRRGIHAGANRVSSDSVDLTHSVVLKSGNAFVVSLPDGDMPLDGDHALGVYRNDGRFLSGHELRIAGARPGCWSSRRRPGRGRSTSYEPGPRAAGWAPARAADAADPARPALARRHDAEERIHVHLYGREPVELDLELALAADFRPMLAIAASRVTRRRCRSRPPMAASLLRPWRRRRRAHDDVTAEPAPDSATAVACASGWRWHRARRAAWS